MHYLTLEHILNLHRMIIARSGGDAGIVNANALESAIAQPAMTFGGNDLYPTLAAKVGALAFSLIGNHPFVDGNKRVGHAAMEVMLVLNGYEIGTTVDEQEKIILALASGQLTRSDFAEWIERNLIPHQSMPLV